MIIISPSYKRAGNVKVRRWLSSIVLAVHEFEEEEYREKEGGELLVIPDEVKGNIARVRNYVLNDCFKRDDNVIMMDDDTKEIVYFENGKRHILNEKQFIDFAENGFVMCNDLGYKLWGLNLLDDPMAYREYSPFSTLAPILGPFSAHIRNSIRYDERIPLKEDYDLALQHLNRFRGILRFNKFAYNVDHIEGEGGCTSYRTRGKEYDQAMILQGKWGDKIVKYNFDKSINPKISCPIAGI